MQIFIKYHDYDLWKIISSEDFIPTLQKGDKVEPKSRSEYTKEEVERAAKIMELWIFYFMIWIQMNLIVCLYVIQLETLGHFGNY